VTGLVRHCGLPAAVPEQVIEAILRRADADTGLHRDGLPLFCTGDPIRLVQGPLAGMEGVFTEEDGEKRVIVLLELLGKANKTRVNRDWVVPVA
jgi:transcriptional antiterminator RfaH